MHNSDIYRIAGNGSYGTSGDNNSATSAELTYPYGVAFTHNDSVVFTHNLTTGVRRVESGRSSPDVASATSATATIGRPFRFSVTTSGDPTPYVQLTGTLPPGRLSPPTTTAPRRLPARQRLPGPPPCSSEYRTASSLHLPSRSRSRWSPHRQRNGPRTPTHCLTAGLNPKHLGAKIGRAVVIRGCDPRAVLLKVGVELLQPHVRVLSSSLRLNGASALSYETPRLTRGREPRTAWSLVTTRRCRDERAAADFIESARRPDPNRGCT